MSIEADYLRAIFSLLGRSAFPSEALAKIVAPAGEGKKQIAAFNLCDGEHTQAQIATAAALDPASLSRSVSRWIEEGVVVRVGDRPVHVYRLPNGSITKKSKSKNVHR